MSGLPHVNLKLHLFLFLKGLQMLDPEWFWVWTSGIQMWPQQRDKLWTSCSAPTSEFTPALPTYSMQGCLTLALLVVGHASHSSRWITVWICPKNYTSHWPRKWCLIYGLHQEVPRERMNMDDVRRCHMLHSLAASYEPTSLESTVRGNLGRADLVLTIVNLIMTSYTMLVNATCMWNLSVPITGLYFDMLMHGKAIRVSLECFILKFGLVTYGSTKKLWKHESHV